MAEFKVGDIVDITIDRAQITSVTRIDSLMEFEGPDGTNGLVSANHPAVNIAQVVPAEWPPQPGDVWRDRCGSAWFAFFGLDAREVFMIPADPPAGELSTPMPDTVLRKAGPLELVHREVTP